MPRLCRLITLGVTIFVIAKGALAAPPNLAPFVLPWNDAAAGITDLSQLLPGSAGSRGRLTIGTDGHIYDGNQRIRFWGVNFAGVPAFPLKEDADPIAARLAKFGVNIVRFHHLDATWYSTALIDYKNGSSQALDPAQLDKTERLVSAFADHGIYTNFNIQTARIFQQNDGLAGDVTSLSGDLDAHKLISMIDPRATALQKQYAKDVLTHVNPYRKQAWKDDPAVAVVEILNEQGLLHSWLGGKIDSLPDPWHGLLGDAWNAWLLDKFGTTSAMSSAWHMADVPFGPELLSNADFSSGTSAFRLEVAGTAQATLSVVAGADGSNSALCIDTTQTSSQAWHVQLNQPGLTLSAGQAYTVSIRIRAQGFTSATFGLRQSVSPWGALPGTSNLSLSSTWQTHTFSFMADKAEPSVRFDLSGFGSQLGQVCISSPSFKVGGHFALDPSLTIETGTVPLVDRGGSQGWTAAAYADFVEFLREREKSYFTGMRDFLRNEVGFGGIVGGTIVGTSTPSVQSAMDVIDSHAYWQHPQFPGIPWDPVNWTISNVSMVDSRPGTLSGLAAEGVVGRPHTVSEYNHPAPNTYSSEAPLLIASFGALEDWDGIYFFDYGSDTNNDGVPDWDTQFISGFTPIDQHPPKMVNFMLGSLIFRNALVSPAQGEAVVAVSDAQERDAIVALGHAWGPMNALDVGMPQEAILKRMRMDLAPGAQSHGIPTASEIAAFGNTWVSDTQELRWEAPGPNSDFVVVDAPKIKSVVGHVPAQGIDLHGLQFVPGETRQNWCTLSAVAILGDFTGAPARIVVVATGDIENTGMQWKDASKSSVGNHWGTAPTLVEPVTATVKLQVAAKRVSAWALDGNGQRAQALPITGDDSTAVISLGLPFVTLWYEVVVGEPVPDVADAGPSRDDAGAIGDAATEPPHFYPAGGGCGCRTNLGRHSGGMLLCALGGLFLARSRRNRREPNAAESPSIRYRLPSKW